MSLCKTLLMSWKLSSLGRRSECVHSGSWRLLSSLSPLCSPPHTPHYSPQALPPHLELRARGSLVWRLRQPTYHLFALKARGPSSVLPQYSVCPTSIICPFELPSSLHQSVGSRRPRLSLSWPLLWPPLSGQSLAQSKCSAHTCGVSDERGRRSSVTSSQCELWGYFSLTW